MKIKQLLVVITVSLFLLSFGASPGEAKSKKKKQRPSATQSKKRSTKVSSNRGRSPSKNKRNIVKVYKPKADFCLMPKEGEVQEFLVLKKRMGSIGTDKYDLVKRPKDLDEAVKDFIASRDVTLYKTERAQQGYVHKGFQRLFDESLQAKFRAAERATGTKAEDLEALGFGESYLDRYAQSNLSSAKGIFEMLDAFARNHHMKFGRRAGQKCRGRGKKRVCVPVPAILDERFNEDRSIEVASVELAKYRRQYGGDTPEGRENQAAAWHCGEGCMNSFMSWSNTYGLQKPTMTKAYLVANSKTTPELEKLVRQHMKIDFSPPYPAGIMRAKLDIRLYRDPATRPEVLERVNRILSASKGSKNPSRYFVFSKPLILGVTTPEIQAVPETEKPAGVTVPVTLKLAPELVGALFYVAAETRLLLTDRCPGEAFTPLRLVSVTADGWSAEIDPKMGAKQRAALDDVLQDIANRGAISAQSEDEKLLLCPTDMKKWHGFFRDTLKEAKKQEKKSEEGILDPSN